MSNPSKLRNWQIGLILSVCYLLGMVGAYWTTQAVSYWRGDHELPEIEQQVARVMEDQ